MNSTATGRCAFVYVSNDQRKAFGHSYPVYRVQDSAETKKSSPKTKPTFSSHKEATKCRKEAIYLRKYAKELDERITDYAKEKKRLTNQKEFWVSLQPVLAKVFSIVGFAIGITLSIITVLLMHGYIKTILEAVGASFLFALLSSAFAIIFDILGQWVIKQVINQKTSKITILDTDISKLKRERGDLTCRAQHQESIARHLNRHVGEL